MYQRILVPLDGSPAAARGLREAIDLAAEHQATLVLLHVIEISALTVEWGYQEMQRRLHQDADRVLAAGRDAAAVAGVQTEAVVREAVHSRIVDVIVEQAARSRCDLVVMGTCGRRGVGHVVLGSNAEQVARRSPVPVLLVRQEQAMA